LEEPDIIIDLDERRSNLEADIKLLNSEILGAQDAIDRENKQQESKE